MWQLFIILAQIGLAFYIISTLYLVMAYYLKNAHAEKVVETPESTPYFENHLAIVFNNYCKEKDLVEQIQNLSQQGYTNYSAFFFVDEPVVVYNALDNIHIMRPHQKKHSLFGFLDLAKLYFSNAPDAVLVLNSRSKMAPGYLHKMNQSLLNGNQVVQSQIQVEDDAGELGTYQHFAKRFFNLIDRDAMQANGLSAAIWNEGFMIRFPLYNTLRFEDYKNNDKALQADLIAHSAHIAYEPGAKLIERNLNEDEFLDTHVNWFNFYAFNIKLGFNLLLEGIKNPNMDKIIFGFNYLRPPLVIMLLASLSLAVIDILWMPQLAFFLWIAITGFGISLLLLIKPMRLLKLIKPIEISLKAMAGSSSSNKKTVDNTQVYLPTRSAQTQI